MYERAKVVEIIKDDTTTDSGNIACKYIITIDYLFWQSSFYYFLYYFVLLAEKKELKQWED